MKNSDLSIFIFSVLFCDFDSLLQPILLLRFDRVDLSHRKSKTAKNLLN